MFAEGVENDGRRGARIVRRLNAFEVGIIAFGAALNITVGYLVAALKLPFYLDSIGTVVIAVLCGWVHGILAGLAGLLVMTVTSTPTIIAYAGTTVVIAVLSHLLAKAGFLKKPSITVIGGLAVGCAAAFASAPVTAFLYGGVSLAGSDAITTFFRASGLPVCQSVLFGGLVTDPLDKLATALIAMLLVRSLPPSLLGRFGGAGSVVSQDEREGES